MILRWIVATLFYSRVGIKFWGEGEKNVCKRQFGHNTLVLWVGYQYANLLSITFDWGKFFQHVKRVKSFSTSLRIDVSLWIEIYPIFLPTNNDELFNLEIEIGSSAKLYYVIFNKFEIWISSD